MMNDLNVLVQYAIYQDIIREAERDRVIRMARAANKGSGLYARVLNWIGGRLATWGNQLQERYGDASLTPQSLPAQTAHSL